MICRVTNFFVVSFVVFLCGGTGVSQDGDTREIVAEKHVSSSNSGGTNLTGININEFVGAHRFYDAGFTGTDAILGNIEAGHVDFGHETLTHVTEQFTGTGAVGTLDDHATWVTHSMSGKLSGGSYPNDYHAYGTAYDATTWSGAIATTINGDGSFSISSASIASVYSGMLKTGSGGQTADIFNSSWGFTEPTGNNIYAKGVDGLLNDTGKIGVVSAGNSGSGANTVGGIGAGYNSITVGSLGSDTAGTPYGSVSGFSSRSPNDFFNELTGQTISQVRAAVDIAAPGQNLTLAQLGTTSGYQSNLAGTSFSSPIVAGGTGLMVDAAKTIYAGNSNAIDGRVIKAALLNGASKIGGWDNGQALNGTIIETTQSLDWASGAGSMDLNKTFDNFVDQGNGGLAGTADVAGLTTGDLGDVDAIGWDFGFVGNEAGVDDTNMYYMDTQLEGGTNFSITLAWFADIESGSDANFAGNEANHLANLDLRVFEYDSLTGRNVIRTVAQSISMYNVVEHLFFDIDVTGLYGFEIGYTAAHWDFGDAETGENYGVAWYGSEAAAAVPEPGTILVFSLIGSVVFIRRRRNI